MICDTDTLSQTPHTSRLFQNTGGILFGVQDCASPRLEKNFNNCSAAGCLIFSVMYSTHKEKSCKVQRKSRISRLNRFSACFIRAVVTEGQDAKKDYNGFVDTL